MELSLPGEKLGLLLRVGLYVFLAIIGLQLFGIIIYPLAGYLIASAMGTFAAGAVANSVLLRVFERGRLADVGLGWQRGSRHNLLLGTFTGVCAALVVLLGPLLVGVAHIERNSAQPGNIGSFFFVTFILLFGAVGEELLFRGYGFQVLLAGLGRYSTILPVSVLFGLAHAGNQNASLLGLINTAGFSFVFCYAFVRSGDLWLPIGLHFGWNWTLPLFGENLSGFTMSVTGLTLRWTVGDIWSGGNYGPEASLLSSIVVVGLVYFLSKAPVWTQPAPLLLRAAEQEETE
jgi:hypothetical protein